jgi:8-oxo-dGTP diphosphatase
VALYLIRHGKAGDRGQWDGRDQDRPLSKRGRRQADGIVAQLGGTPLVRIFSSPYIRCVQSVEPLARKRALSVEVVDELTEGAPVEESLTLFEKFSSEEVALCSHGDVIGNLLDHARERGVEIGDDVKFEKGSTWVFEFEQHELAAARYLAPPAK